MPTSNPSGSFELSNVPRDLTVPNKKYKQQIALATLAIIAFIVLYFGLAFWFLYKSYFLFADLFSGGRNGFSGFMVAVLTAFLGVFMLKALFFLNRSNKSEFIEITKEEEPQLFEFIYKVADDAKASRPHKIFLSNRVNASVFYDLSFINLIFPTRKNLEIGLGLVNALNLGEFRSIISHEFGHFAQRSMIVGRWVYIAHQVVFQIVNKRDGFDKFINGLSRIDIRVAWIGWILSLIVWSIRSLVEIFFKMVLLTERALSREMEFHADLVSVSLTGSDALVNSLHKLTAADETFDSAIDFLNRQLADKKKVENIYALQENAIAQMRVVLNNAEYGTSPAQNTEAGKQISVFKEQIAQAPKMWSTHPSNIDRERNAKRIYIRADIDDRPAWVVFTDPEKTKEKLTAEIFRDIKMEATPLSKEESLEIQSKEFKRTCYLTKYRGVYLNRYTLLYTRCVSDIYISDINIQNIGDKFESLYPAELQNNIARIKDLSEELFMLEGISSKKLKASTGKIVYRGNEIKRNELPDTVRSVKEELETEMQILDRQMVFCRNLHYQVAKTIGKDWAEYLRSLTMLAHYCEHTLKNIEVKSKYFFDTVRVLHTMRKVESTDILYLCRIANDLHDTLKNVFTYGPSIGLNDKIIARLNGKKFEELLEPFKLNEAESANINSWIGVVGSWIKLADRAINELRLAALDELLETEACIEEMTISKGANPITAPTPIKIEDNYPKHDPQNKYEVIDKSDFMTKFHNAEGFLPSLAKYTAAAIIVFFAVSFAAKTGTSRIVIYNGFPKDIIVNIDNKKLFIEKEKSLEIDIDVVPEIDIQTTTKDGRLVESFKQKMNSHTRTYVYNVANSAFIYTWTAYYGFSNPPNNDHIYGVQRWMEINAEDYFVSPPESVSLQAGETQTRIVVAEQKGDPGFLISLIDNKDERNTFIATHVIWEEPSSQFILSWLTILNNQKNANEIIRKRLEVYPLDIPALRAKQDMAKGQEKEKICEEQRKLLENNPENPDFYYLNCRCEEDEVKQRNNFIAGYNKWPDNPWLAYATGYSYTQTDNWEEALKCFKTSFNTGSAFKLYLIDQIKRIDQLLDKPNPEELNNLVPTYLSFVDNVEHSTELNIDNKYFAFKLLAKGAIDSAVNFVQPDTNINGYILRLAAVSEGASRAISNRAFNLRNNAYINNSTIVPAIAFNLKNNIPLSSLKKAINQNFGAFADSVYKFINLVKSNKIDEADKLTRSGEIEIKGKMSLLGTLILGNKAPVKWRLYANKLLYITEKPYLRK